MDDNEKVLKLLLSVNVCDHAALQQTGIPAKVYSHLVPRDPEIVRPQHVPDQEFLYKAITSPMFQNYNGRDLQFDLLFSVFIGFIVSIALKLTVVSLSLCLSLVHSLVSEVCGSHDRVQRHAGLLQRAQQGQDPETAGD